MSEQDNVQFVRNAYDAFKRGDIDAVLNTLADDIEWISPGPPDIMPTAGTRRGRQAVKEFFAVLSQQEDVEVFEPQEFIAQGDKVVAILKYRGRVKATGKPAEATLVHVFDFANGKVKRFREFFDTASVLPAYTSVQAAVK
ncbi:MAG TPA: nuclear transport factor 2 family protein [Pyrinomonadaceae bacterium]|jgi:hypothetical protein